VRELTRYIAFTGRYNTPAALIYFDLNHMKKTNDSLGHAAGDAVLAHFSDVLQAHVRDSDCVGRLGGDEFGVLLSHANHDQALKKADALAAALDASPTVWNGHSIPVSFAYGAFELQSGDNPDIAIARADQAMYAQKRSQRAAAE
jgi:diguanylate cyclase (GGDEF)-like protein